jgi:hypothetical protein
MMTGAFACLTHPAAPELTATKIAEVKNAVPVKYAFLIRLALSVLVLLQDLAGKKIVMALLVCLISGALSKLKPPN